MINLETVNDLNDASNALRDWFKSQDICPSDGMLIFEFFIAKMILVNGKSPEDIDQKFELIEDTIRAFMSTIKQVDL